MESNTKSSEFSSSFSSTSNENRLSYAKAVRKKFFQDNDEVGNPAKSLLVEPVPGGPNNQNGLTTFDGMFSDSINISNNINGGGGGGVKPHRDAPISCSARHGQNQVELEDRIDSENINKNNSIVSPNINRKKFQSSQSDRSQQHKNQNQNHHHFVATSREQKEKEYFSRNHSSSSSSNGNGTRNSLNNRQQRHRNRYAPPPPSGLDNKRERDLGSEKPSKSRGGGRELNGSVGSETSSVISSDSCSASLTDENFSSAVVINANNVETEIDGKINPWHMYPNAASILAKKYSNRNCSSNISKSVITTSSTSNNSSISLKEIRSDSKTWCKSGSSNARGPMNGEDWPALEANCKVSNQVKTMSLEPKANGRESPVVVVVDSSNESSTNSIDKKESSHEEGSSSSTSTSTISLGSENSVHRLDNKQNDSQDANSESKLSLKNDSTTEGNNNNNNNTVSSVGNGSVSSDDPEQDNSSNERKDDKKPNRKASRQKWVPLQLPTLKSRSRKGETEREREGDRDSQQPQQQQQRDVVRPPLMEKPNMVKPVQVNIAPVKPHEIIPQHVEQRSPPLPPSSFSINGARGRYNNRNYFLGGNNGGYPVGPRRNPRGLIVLPPITKDPGHLNAMRNMVDEYSDYPADYGTVAPMFSPMSEYILPYSMQPPYNNAHPQYLPPGEVQSPTFVSLTIVDDSMLLHMVKKQIEYYFSEENLEKDFFLRRKMDSEGYLPIQLIASFHRMISMTHDFNALSRSSMVLSAIKASDKLDLKDDQSSVRTLINPTKWPIVDTSQTSGVSSQTNSNAPLSPRSLNGVNKSENGETQNVLNANVSPFVPKLLTSNTSSITSDSTEDK